VADPPEPRALPLLKLHDEDRRNRRGEGELDPTLAGHTVLSLTAAPPRPTAITAHSSLLPGTFPLRALFNIDSHSQGTTAEQGGSPAASRHQQSVTSDCTWVVA
jgi:hypothetical protein